MTGFLYTKKAGAQQGLARAAPLGDSDAISTEVSMRLEAARHTQVPGQQAPLSAVNFLMALPRAKDRRAVASSLGCRWDGGVRQGARHAWAQSPLCSYFLTVDLGQLPPPEPCFPHPRAGQAQPMSEGARKEGRK